MITKFHIHKVRTTISGFLLLGCALVAHHGWSFLTTINTIKILFDSNFSPSCALLLEEKLACELRQYAHGSTELLNAVRSHVPSIDTIEADLYAPGCIAYTITALLPRFAINNTVALCDNNKLIPRAWYHQALYEQLPVLTTTEPLQAETAPIDLRLLAHHVSPSIVNQYDVTWKNGIETELTYKKDPTFTIVCNAESLRPGPVAACQKIYTDVKSHTLPLKQRSEALHADIRFTNQIVIHADQGRTVHG